MVETGVNAEGYREILGIHTATTESAAGWLAFFRDLTARGLSGVALVTSDAHAGLVEAIGATLPGRTSLGSDSRGEYRPKTAPASGAAKLSAQPLRWYRAAIQTPADSCQDARVGPFVDSRTDAREALLCGWRDAPSWAPIADHDVPAWRDVVTATAGWVSAVLPAPVPWRSVPGHRGSGPGVAVGVAGPCRRWSGALDRRRIGVGAEPDGGGQGAPGPADGVVGVVTGDGGVNASLIDGSTNPLRARS